MKISNEGTKRLLVSTLLAAAMGLAAAPAFSQSPQPSQTPGAPGPAPSIAVDSSRPQQQPGAGMVSSFAPVVEKVAPSVVSVHTSRTVKVPRMFREFFGTPNAGVAQGLGSGVIVSPDGYILTNNHVTAGADEILVNLGEEKKEYKAKKIGADPGTDLAVLKIEAGDHLPAITFADSDKARVGDVVLAVGNPYGLTQTVTMGIVSGLGRMGVGIVDYENFIQTDASVNPGNSGGALVDVEGRLLGINTAIFSRSGGNQGIGFAVPANLARQVLQSIREKGRVVRGYLGTVIQPVSEDLAKVFKLKEPSGALVSDVEPDSPAQKAGIKHGDVIVSANGKKIENPRELRLVIGGLAPGAKVAIGLVRGGKEKTVEAVLAELPQHESGLPPEAGAPSPEAAGILDGVKVSGLNDELRHAVQAPGDLTGAIVTGIDPESAAYQAGLRQGFVIQEINRRPVKNAQDAVAAAKAVKSGEPALLRVWSDGQSHYLTVEPK